MRIERIARERMRRLSMDPPASPQVEPSTVLAAEHAIAGPSSERREVRSVRSTTSATTRLRLAELEAAEKLAALTRRELEMEVELVKKRLAAEVSVIQDDQESVQDEALHDEHQHQHQKRLRTCLKGEAREAVAALLHTATDPAVIMRTLAQCFGRPEMIIDKALDELKLVPRPGPSAAELNNFAVKSPMKNKLI
ncbi:hypothetical protein B5X24_HaOG213486 [Helicoverpa armigera]|uniref:Uncharacterized protein n=1 Tax=Helicoverpa armigera TaxID=29058 RepID=A0A2W1BIC6_HELAM|nr:hypothetical protein B5X24_HaOG213486 [Helicoverpa armigera]